MHFASLTGTTFGNGFCAFHHQTSAFFTDIPCWLCLDGKFAFWVVGTRIKNSESSATLTNISCFTNRAEYTGPLFCLIRFIAFYEFTFRVTGTGNKCACAVSAFADYQLSAPLPRGCGGPPFFSNAPPHGPFTGFF